jgi:hypothetical protein
VTYRGERWRLLSRASAARNSAVGSVNIFPREALAEVVLRVEGQQILVFLQFAVESNLLSSQRDAAFGNWIDALEVHGDPQLILSVQQ